MGNKYRIHVGRVREGENAVTGFLEKGSNHIISGKTTPVAIRVGTFGIPNGTQAWGIRLDKKGKVPENPIRVDDDNYRGEIKWLKWGEAGGTMIRARYIPGYQTIDKDYQDTRLGVKIVEGFLDSGEPISLLEFRHGKNEYDEETDKGLVEMLKIHHHNNKSVSCNPEADGWMYTEEDEVETSDASTKLIETKGECLLLVSSASNKPENIKALFEIVRDAKNGSGINKEDAAEIYTWLSHFADAEPKIFSSKINLYKTNVSALIEKAKSYNILDLTKDGFVAAGEKTKEVILQDVPAKGEKMLEWAFDHCLEPEVFDGLSKLSKITETLK